MARRFIVRPLAEADLEDAARWYEEERAGLAARFLSDVDRTFARIRGFSRFWSPSRTAANNARPVNHATPDPALTT